MNDRQRSQIDMYHRLKEFFQKHIAEWSTMPGFVAAVNEFDAIITGLDATLMRQLRGDDGTSAGKAAARKKFGQAIMQLSLGMQGYALSTANTALMDQVKTRPSSLLRATETSLLGIAQLLVDEATAALPSLGPFGITAATLAQLDALRAEFAGLIGKPGERIKAQAEATAELAAAIQAARLILKTRIDTLADLLDHTHPGFALHYRIMRRIHDAGHRKRALSVTIVDASTGAPLQGVQALVMPDKKKLKTNARGRFVVQHMGEGGKQLSFTLPGYAIVETKAYIVKGETAVVKVGMEKG